METRVLVQEGKKGPSIKLYNVRTSYAFVSTPKKDQKGGEYYSCDFLIPKNAPGVNDLKEAVKKLAQTAFAGKTGWKSAVLKDGDKLIADYVEQGGDAEDREIYKGCMVVSAKTTQKPNVAGNIYSGCYVCALVNVRSYDFKDEAGANPKGIKGYLDSVVFHADGEKLGGDGGSSDPYEALGLSKPADQPFEDDTPF